MTQSPPALPSPGELIQAQADNPNTALLSHQFNLSWQDYVRLSKAYASLMLAHRSTKPFHVGLLLGNSINYCILLAAAAMAGAVLVGLNNTRRDKPLADDVSCADCCMLFTDSTHLSFFNKTVPPVPTDSLFVIDTPEFEQTLKSHQGTQISPQPMAPEDLFLLIFTSGTSGAPKAVRMSAGRLVGYSQVIAATNELTSDDVMLSSMPLFHSNGLITSWCPFLLTGATLLPTVFSARNFLTDVKHFGVTYFNYVGKALAYILATPEQPDDSDNTLRLGYGNEAAFIDLKRFKERFHCELTDGYGSTEGGVFITRTPDTPEGALGVGMDDSVHIINRDSGEECPLAMQDEKGLLLNADTAIGEIVNIAGTGTFEGYYNNPEATQERTADNRYWSGDLGFKDAKGFIWFAGRSSDWLRVDGENFASAPVERILCRHPAVRSISIYAVPDPKSGDQVMACLLLAEDGHFQPEDWQQFCAQQQDLSPKWLPRYIRITKELPDTPSLKTLKRLLRNQAWLCDDPVWWRQSRSEELTLLTEENITTLKNRFDEADRLHFWPNPKHS